MPAKIPCPDAQALRQLLLGRIPPPDCDSLYDHLENCDQCERNAQNCPADDWLHDALRSHDGDEAEVPSVLQLIESLRRAGPPHPEPAEDEDDYKPTRMSDTIPPPGESADPRRELYDFLAPAREPGELGRLGQYRILKVLGSGGMGVVFHAEDPALQRPVALKAMLPALAARASARSRFLREGRAAAALLHDHIVAIYQVGEDRGVPFLAMPLLPGESLEDRLQRERTLPVDEVCRIGREIAQGLAAAHARGLVHRDVKPANIWLEQETGVRATSRGGRVKILDFGLARPANDAQLTAEGAILGTPAYMAPEQAAGAAVDGRSDLFSLGCVLYRTATGELPFQGADAVATLVAVSGQAPRPPREIRRDLPQPLNELVLRLLTKKPESRPASAQAVVEAIRIIEQSMGGSGGAPLTARSRLFWRGSLAAVVVLLLSVLGLIGLFFRSQTTPLPVTPAKATTSHEEPTPSVAAPLEPAPVAAPPKPPPVLPDEHWQVVARLSSPRLDELMFKPPTQPGQINRDYRAVAFHWPYVYAINAKSFVSGDLLVFKLPTEAPRPDASLLLIEDRGLIEDAGDGGDLCVIGDVLLCTHLGGFKVFSLKDPAKPLFVQRVGPAPRPRLSHTIIRVGNLACLAGESGNIAPASYLSVFDLSTPAEPKHVSLSLIKHRGWCGSGVGDRLYLGTIKQWDRERNGVAVYNLANPEAPREEGFVETDMPFQVFGESSGRTLLAVSEGRMQTLSLADPAKPTLLDRTGVLDDRGGYGGRSAAYVEIGGRGRVVGLKQVFAVEEKGFRELYRYQNWNVGSGLPHHGSSQNGYVAVPTQQNVIVLWSAALGDEKPAKP